MDKISLGLESMTLAIKVRRYMRDVGIDSRLIKADGITNVGCQYGISIERSDYLKAVAELNRRKIKYRVIE